MLVANGTVPNRTRTPLVILQIKMKEEMDNDLNGCCASSLHSLSPNAHTRNRPKPSTLDLVPFVRVDWKHEHEHINQGSIPSGLHVLQQCVPPQINIGSWNHAHITTRWQICFVVFATRRQSSLYHMPRKSALHEILTSLTCAYQSHVWIIRYHSVVRARL